MTRDGELSIGDDDTGETIVLKNQLQQERQARLAAEERELGNAQIAYRNALAVEQNGLDRCEAMLATALAEYDNEQAAKLMREQGMLQRRIEQLAAESREVEARVAQRGTQPTPEQQREHIERYIVQAHHTPAMQRYLRDHYNDLFSNDGARTNKLAAGHYQAVAEGIKADTPEYYRFLDNYLGYDGSGASPRRGGRRKHAAQLDDKQKEFCRETGISEADYLDKYSVSFDAADGPDDAHRYLDPGEEYQREQSGAPGVAPDQYRSYEPSPQRERGRRRESIVLNPEEADLARSIAAATGRPLKEIAVEWAKNKADLHEGRTSYQLTSTKTAAGTPTKNRF
jgi:hypothetical protein